LKTRIHRHFVAAALLAATASPLPAADPQVLQEIEVKAKKESRTESLEVREVRECPAHDIGEALEGTGNVVKVRKGGIANDIVIRGFQRDNINVLIDGARLQGACPNRMDPPSFHLDYAEIDVVDVKKGPFDVWNPGSMGGVVDVRTRPVAPGAHGELNLGYGSFDSVETSGVLSYGGHDAGILGGLAYKYSKPYESGDGKRFTELVYPKAGNNYRPDERDGTAYSILTGWAKGSVRTGQDSLLEVSWARQAADDVLYPYLYMDAVYDDTDRLNAVFTAKDVGLLKNAKLQAYWNEVRHDMDDTKRCSSTDNAARCLNGAPVGSLPRPYSMRTYAESRMSGGKAEATFGGSAATTVGADFYMRDWNATTTRKTGPVYVDNATIPDVTMVNVGMYAEHRRALSAAARLTAGVRLDSTNSSPGIDRSAFYSIYYGPDLDLYHTDILLSGNVQLDYDFSNTFSAFIGLGHGTRVPDPQERYFALAGIPGMSNGTTGNPNLVPVKNNEADVALKYSTGKVLAKVQLFYSDLADYIVVTNIRGIDNTTVKTYQNVDATIYGGEASARVSLPWNLFASGRISYTRGRNDTYDINLPEMPPLMGGLSLRYDVEAYFGEVEWVASARQDRTDSQVQETPTPGWAIVNLKAGCQYKGLKVFAGVKNLFDKYYTEYLSYLRDPFAAGVKVPEPGVTLYANLQYSF
jgi:iron complex outermembrane receptor protein